jgi:hypothetical protein
MTFNPLNSIWLAYQISHDCFRVTKTAFKQQGVNHSWLAQTVFYQQSDILVISLFEQGEIEIDDLFVLGIWAAFERHLRGYLQTKGKKLQEVHPPALASSFYQQLYQELEYWRPSDMLNLLKSILPYPSLVGQAKQILEYRDWIAPGKNPDRVPSANITPKFAYNTLSEIVQVMLLN